MKTFEGLTSQDLQEIKGGINEMTERPTYDDCIV